MTIDKSGKWWKGENFDDLAEYIKLLTAEGYPAEQVIHCVCICGNTTFRLVSGGESAQRICAKCGEAALICDSPYWEDAEPEKVRCPCRNMVFEVGVGYSFRSTGDIKWITVGERCTECGTLGSCADWKVDYSPSRHLLSMA